jgi:hypothetical protein
MRLPIILLLALFTAVFALPPPQKPVVVSFPDDTPASIIDKAMAEVEKDGGIITHEYCMLFSCAKPEVMSANTFQR